MVSRNSPASTGESIKVSNGADSNWISPLLVPAMGSAVPKFQPAGSFRLAAKGIFNDAALVGYNSNWVQLKTTRWAVEDPPEENAPPLADGKKSSDASTAVTPAGTVTWMANMSSAS